MGLMEGREGGNKKSGLYCTIAGFFYRSLEREGSMTWSLEMKWTVNRARIAVRSLVPSRIVLLNFQSLSTFRIVVVP